MVHPEKKKRLVEKIKRKSQPRSSIVTPFNVTGGCLRGRDNLATIGAKIIYYRPFSILSIFWLEFTENDRSTAKTVVVGRSVK